MKPKNSICLSESRHAVKLVAVWNGTSQPLEVPSGTWAQILAGREVQLEGSPYNCQGTSYPTGWIFNAYPDATLIVAYGEDGEVGYAGPIEGAIVR